jgi:hypothetical protein
LGADVAELLVGGGLVVQTSAKAPEQVPVDEAVQGTLVFTGLEGVDLLVDLALKAA